MSFRNWKIRFQADVVLLILTASSVKIEEDPDAETEELLIRIMAHALLFWTYKFSSFGNFLT